MAVLFQLGDQISTSNIADNFKLSERKIDSVQQPKVSGET